MVVVKANPFKNLNIKSTFFSNKFNDKGVYPK